jgi:hypothetical protein
MNEILTLKINQEEEEESDITQKTQMHEKVNLKKKRTDK